MSPRPREPGTSLQAALTARSLDLLRALVELESPSYSPCVRDGAGATGREPLGQAAPGAGEALVVEPTTPSGDLKTSRKGLGRFRLTVTGKPAHAGNNRADGVSAIEELAHQVLALHALNDDGSGLSFNVGVVSGGTSENVVAASAEAQID